MIARGDVPVSHPVDADGAVTVDVGRMVGLAGRGDPNRTIWRDGEEFELITDKGCLMIVREPMEIMIGSVAYKLGARENHYVTVRNGKVIDFQGRNSNR